MVAIEQENQSKITVAEDLQILHDDVVEFRECCARLCDSVFAEPTDAGDGGAPEASMKMLSAWMKERMDSVSEELIRIRKKVEHLDIDGNG